MSLITGTQKRERYTLLAGVEQQITFDYVVDEKGNRTYPNTFIFRQFAGSGTVKVSLFSTEANTKPYKQIAPSADGMIVEPAGTSILYLYCASNALVEITSWWDDSPDVTGIGVGQDVNITNSSTISTVAISDGGDVALGSTTDSANYNTGTAGTLIAWAKGQVFLLNTITGQIVAGLASLVTGNANTASVDTKLTYTNTMLDNLYTDTGELAGLLDILEPKILAPAGTPTIYHVTLTTLNTEYSQALPAGTQKFTVNIIGGVGSNSYRMAFETGKVATPVAPYLQFPDNLSYSEDGLDLTSKTLYIASSASGQTAQIIVWA